MKGKYHFKVYNKKLLFEFDIKRNITFIQGNSATGKTTLLNMMYDYLLSGRGSGITVETNAKFMIYLRKSLTATWKQELGNLTDTIIFIEENNRFIQRSDFTKFVKESGNYFVFINRKALKMLPYSVTEIYRLQNKYSEEEKKQVYTLQQRYPTLTYMNGNVNLIATEDSNSGLEFFSKVFNNIEITSTYGNTKVISFLENIENTDILCIVDGAAFGCFIKDLISTCNQHPTKHITYWAPESFEFLLLTAKTINFPELDKILKDTYNYVDCIKFVSWERFYTFLMETKSNGQAAYDKHSITQFYITEENINKVLKIFPKSIQLLAQAGKECKTMNLF